MKIQLTKPVTILTFVLATSAFSQTKDEKQFSSTSPDESVSKLNYKIDPYRILIAKGKTEYIKVLKTLDWFKQKEERKKKEILNTIQNDLDVNYLFLALEDHNFDTEGFENAESYKNLLNELAKIAGVQKKIKNLKVVRKGKLINISVLINNSDLKYSINTNLNQDWIDSNFIEQFINEQLLTKADSTKKFFWLPSTDQIANLIFISKKEFEEATRNGLIPTDKIFIE